MRWRRQLPAYSPLPLRAVGAGARGLVSGGSAARAQIEAMLAARFGGAAVVLTDSGTAALTLAIAACLDATSGAPVALPAYCCYDVATAADGAEAPVVLYDVDPTTLAPDTASLRRALGRGARAIVLAHLYGMPVDPAPVREAIGGSGAWLIEDAAQGAGASMSGAPLGSFGDLSVLSFGRGKGCTGGRGGALLAPIGRGGDLVGRARAGVGAGSRRGRLREVVQLGAQWLLGRPSLYAIPASIPFLRLGETIYRPAERPLALSGVAGAALAASWPLCETEAAMRKANARRLLASAGAGLVPFRVAAGAEAGFLRLPLLASPAARAAITAAEARALGVMPGYPQPLSDLPRFGRRIMNPEEPRPGARLLAERLVTLPVHGLLAEGDILELERWAARLRD